MFMMFAYYLQFYHAYTFGIVYTLCLLCFLWFTFWIFTVLYIFYSKSLFSSTPLAIPNLAHCRALLYCRCVRGSPGPIELIASLLRRPRRRSPLRTHKTSSLLFDHPPSTRKRNRATERSEWVSCVLHPPCARIKLPPFCLTIPLPTTYAIARELLNGR